MKKHSVLIAFASVALSSSGLAAPTNKPPKNGLAALDANGDGVIGRKEALSAQVAAFHGLDKNGDNTLSLDELPAPRVKPGSGETAKRAKRQARQRLFDNLDKNNDGKITLGEYQAAMTPYFDRLDRNGDGVIDADELKTVLKHK